MSELQTGLASKGEKLSKVQTSLNTSKAYSRDWAILMSPI